MSHEKTEKVARGAPGAALCKQLIYAHILCITGLDYSRRSPGSTIPLVCFILDYSHILFLRDYFHTLLGWILPNTMVATLFLVGFHKFENEALLVANWMF